LVLPSTELIRSMSLSFMNASARQLGPWGTARRAPASDPRIAVFSDVEARGALDAGPHRRYR
jgi:hypothetical protein